MLFPVHLDGTLLDNSTSMKAKKETFSTTEVLHIFRQVTNSLWFNAIFFHLLQLTIITIWRFSIWLFTNNHVINGMTRTMLFMV